MTNGESKAMPFIISIGALLICWYEIQKLAEGFPRQNKFGLLLNKDAAVCVERGACRIQSSLVPDINEVVPRHTFSASEKNFPQWTWRKLHTHQDESPSPGADWSVLSLGASVRSDAQPQKWSWVLCGRLIKQSGKAAVKAVCLDFNEEF